MAKQRVSNYVFLPGVSSTSNAYPNAYRLINENKDFLKAEIVAYINNNIATDNLANQYPNAVTLLTNNKQFIIDEIIAWIAYQVTNSISPFAGYTYNTASCRRDTGLLIDALIYDIRYGGNEQTLFFAKQLWQGGSPQLISPVQETVGFTQVFTIINNYILPKTLYSSQQSPVTTTQNTSGSAGEAGAITQIGSLRDTIVIPVIAGGLSVLPSTIYSSYNYAGYIFDSAKCYRDVGYVLDAYLNDLRYGGNSRTRFIASRFWHGDIPQLGGDRKPEITAQTYLKNLINNFILANLGFTPLQTQVPYVTIAGISSETGATGRITALATSFINVLTNGLSSLPTLVNGVTTIRLQGKYVLNQLLLITNTTNNQIIYNFSDGNIGARVNYDLTTNTGVGDPYSDEFPAYRNTADYVTEIILEADTSTCSITDDIQIFFEAKEQRVRPYDYGTDAIERMRVAPPQSMLDADFEYGLQPTKWQAIGIARGYPSVYEIPGTDTAVVSVVTDASTGSGGTGESLMTVTTSAAHGFTAGTPITIKSLANTITGFNRAEGTFLINSVPTTTTFTYYATAKVGTSNGQTLATGYTQLRKGGFYTGASIGSPIFSVYSNGQVGSFSSKFITASGSSRMAFTGIAPSNGSPVTATGINSGTQITSVVGSGSLITTNTVNTTAAIGSTSITLISASGVLEGSAIDNGSGTSIFVSSVVGNTINLTGPITTQRQGDTQTYTNVSGTNITPTSSGATFDVTILGNSYDVVVVNQQGTGYYPNEKIIVSGTLIGGITPDNDLTVIVGTVGGSGNITGISSFTGTAPNATANFTVTDSGGGGAQFSVSILNNQYYAVSPTAQGSGYSLGQQIVITGDLLGGATPANDLTLTVTQLSGSGVTLVGFSGTSITASVVFTNKASSVATPAGANGTFDITRSSGSYSITVNVTGTGYRTGDTIKVLGTSLGGATPANDATITINSTGPTGTISTEGISGTSVTGVNIDFWPAVAFSDVTTAQIADSTTITTSAIATIQVTYTTNHGLVPGSSVLIDITSTGNNHAYAKGPFFVEQVPTPVSFRYTARTTGSIDTLTALTGIVYARPQSFFVHRPYDGGVQLGTGGPQHGAQAIRMSKKYIRYQSGKGINYCTGALFAPSFSLQSLSASGTSIGSFITITTDDTDHGCQPGGVIKVDGVETKGYNGTYTITDIIDERSLRVQAQTVLANIVTTLTTNAQMSILKWHGSTVRAGTFDDQNGLFMQYDGQRFAVGRRSSTFQISGTVNINANSNTVTGSNTRFRDQIKAGDRITIKGMTHVVTQVTSNTSLFVTPDYRGASNATNAKACLVQDFIIPQSQFNIDKIDGTGPSGYNLDITKMQMIGMQWSWYAVGFIDFMMRGSDGNFVFFHRIRNSNVNTEAYMRTGNQPVRYEVINESAKDKLASSITATQTSITLTDASAFPAESAFVYIDNELIEYNNKSGNTLTGCTRAAPMLNFVGGANRTFTGGPASTHEYNTGVILVSNTISPIISHWGSAMLTDGNFDEDRGYLFNYASTGIQASTTKQTAFLIRLAPSVSNAIVGDLGDRELLNRAQLLLQTIEVTSDSGTGGLVIEGVLNPQNYPTDPGTVSWAGLSSSGAGGQPSFAQIAPGGSISWSGGASTTTSTATTTSTLSGTAQGPSNTLFATSVGGNTYYVTKTSWDTLGATAGYSVLQSDSKFPTGTTVSSVTANPNPTATTLGLITGAATVPNSATYAQGGPTSATNVSISGTVLTVSGTVTGYLSSNQTISGGNINVGTKITGQITGTAGGTGTYTVSISQNSNASTMSATGSNILYFTQASWTALGAGIGSAVYSTDFSVGTTVTNVTGPTTAGAFTYYTVTFSTNSTSTHAANSTTTFYVTGAANVGVNTLNFTQASWVGLPIGSNVVTNTVNDLTKFANGTTITNISALKTFAGVNYYTITFSTNTLTSLPVSSVVTFSYTPYYALVLSKNAAVNLIYSTASACSVSGTTLTVGGTVTGYFSYGMIVSGSGITANAQITGQLTGTTGGAGTYSLQIVGGGVYSGNVTGPIAITGNPTVHFTPAIIGTNTSFLYFTQASWETLVTTYGATTGTLVSDPTKFPANTVISSVSTLQTFSGTNYYRVNFNQSSITSISGGSTITFQFGTPPYALPGETVFSFIAAPGTTSSLDLSGLKELTNTTLGGRGTYPNGPDILAVNVYKTSGTAIPANIVLRWGEAQA